MAKPDLVSDALENWDSGIRRDARKKAIWVAVETASLVSGDYAMTIQTREGVLGLLLTEAYRLLQARNTPEFISRLYGIAGVAIAAGARFEHGLMETEEMARALAQDGAVKRKEPNAE